MLATINRNKPIKQPTRVLLAAMLAVPLIGWFHAPAVGDEQPFVPTKVTIDKLIAPVPTPNYDVEVLAPLHQQQAAAAAEAARQAQLAEQQRQAAAQAELARAREVQLAQAPAVTGNCADWMTQAGITDTVNAYKVIMRESGCNPYSVNASSGACGIGQQLPCGKWPHAWNDPVGAMIDMQNYVVARYGSWANALAFHYAHSWY